MPIDKSAIRRGMFITGAPPPMRAFTPPHQPARGDTLTRQRPIAEPTYLAAAIHGELRALMQKHGITSAPRVLCLQEPESAFPMILEGFASTGDVDLERMLLAPQALLPSPFQVERSKLAPVPLLWRHDPNQPAGEILDLHYDQRGRLFIRARVTHELAKRAPAFSVGISKIRTWQMVDADTRQFHARVERATLDEISLTDRPANPHARVTFRCLGEEGRKFHRMERRA